VNSELKKAIVATTAVGALATPVVYDATIEGMADDIVSEQAVRQEEFLRENGRYEQIFPTKDGFLEYEVHEHVTPHAGVGYTVVVRRKNILGSTMEKKFSEGPLRHEKTDKDWKRTNEDDAPEPERKRKKQITSTTTDKIQRPEPEKESSTSTATTT
jgi:hypothetical protein